MRYRRHRLAVNLVIGHRQDLRCLAGRPEREARTAGAAHAESVPCRERLKRVVLLEEGDEDLVGGAGILGAARRGDDAVGIGTVGTDGGTPLEADLRSLTFDRGTAWADVATRFALGRG